MGRTSRCSGCKTPRSEHSFGKPGKYCNGPTQGSDATEGTAPPLESLPVEEVKDLSIEDTLASLLGAVKSLTTGLDCFGGYFAEVARHAGLVPTTHVRPKQKSASSAAGKSLKSGKESKITTPVLFPQLHEPHKCSS